MEPNFSWIYLIILFAIPLSRIIPRILAKRRMMAESPGNEPQASPSESSFGSKPEMIRKPDLPKSSKPQTKRMLVLGELHRGAKTFENIQKNTGFKSTELDSILEDLEKNKLIRIEQKQGLLGMKIELHPTEKGFQEYYS